MPASDVQSQLPAASYTRLHITPFDESLFHVVVPSAVRPHARNLSYHTLQAFPDKPYGFVELPADDAERLKKKLNSAVLRGHKLRIEVARIPAETTATAAPKNNNAPAPARGLRKRKREQGVILGTEIDGRKIKRGWTTSEAEMIQKKRDRSGKAKEAKGDKKDKKDRSEVSTSTKKSKKSEVKKSKYTDDPECLFKARLPSKGEPTVATEALQEGEETTAAPKKKKRRIERDTVIHEFERSNKFPSFLKVNSSVNSAAEALTFEDGKGWMDKDGNVLESSKSTRPPTAGIMSAKPKREKKKKPAVVAPPQESSDPSSVDDSSAEDEILQALSNGRSAHKIEEADDMTSSEEESSEDESSEDEEAVSQAEPKGNQDAPKITEQTTPKADGTRPRSAGSVNNLTIKIPPATPVPVKVHPLEALYKKPQGGASTPDQQESKGFSFFDNNDNDDDIEEEGTAATQTLQVPMTPFTERDFEFRTARSAAPTPDTAHPNRSFAPWSTQETVDEEDEDEEGDIFQGGVNRKADTTEEDLALLDADGIHPSRATAVAGPAPITDFQKHFWENRGDLNRKWRKRRKTAAKEKRYRDNRARADRAI